MRTVLSLSLFVFPSLALQVGAQDRPVVKDSEAAQHLVKNVEVQSQSFYPTHLQDWFVVIGTSVTVVGVLLGGCIFLAESDRTEIHTVDEIKPRQLEVA